MSRSTIHQSTFPLPNHTTTTTSSIHTNFVDQNLEDKLPSTFTPPCPFMKLAKMTMEARHKRMLEEVLKLPGNDNCADCHASAPRWASVNLGIFLCVGCASVHRKMGTHKSRVKSVTLDTWTREQIIHMKEVGNTISNSIFNPNEKLHPPPPSYGHDERDSEIERYIRKKYEMGIFKVGSKPSSSSLIYEPTSLNRARERNGKLPFNSLSQNQNQNSNDIISFNKKEYNSNYRDRDLPELPNSNSNPSNQIENRNRNVPAPWATPSTNSGTPPPPPLPSSSTNRQPQQQQQINSTRDENLIDFSIAQTQNATLPLQINMSSSSSIPQQQQTSQQNGYLSTSLNNQQQQQQQQQFGYNNNISNSPSQGFISNGFGNGNSQLIGTGMGIQNNNNNNGYFQQFGSNLSPQSNYNNNNNGFINQIPLTPNSTPSPAFSNSPLFSNLSTQPINQFQYQQYQISPSFNINNNNQQQQQQQQSNFIQNQNHSQVQQQQQQQSSQFINQQSYLPQQQQGQNQNQFGNQQNNDYINIQNGITMQSIGMRY
uniref:Arf-GAP domain-containing protein n=2 Tax=Kwoniella pini CBS 10737 TaxID=1296096 RepID=A0A1B9HU23_9TREE|nr:uncharacterized protein I206_07155 [Kwoniella pini CBS 10737]OCF46768.1 hypothetical protein I206_07155 [Kwoniella pini CBS 10737]